MRIRYTQPALSDLEAILAYISAHSPQGAMRVQTRIQAVIELLVMHPLVGTNTDDSSIRRLPTPPYPYLIFYEAAVDEVIIHALRHSARDPSSMPGPA